MSLDICFENVNFSYKRKNLILENINIEIKKGEFVGIVGPNGGGKTTFLKLVLGLLKPTSGKILVQNKKPRFSKRKGYVPHLDNIDMNFPISVLDVVLMGCLNQKRLSKGKCRAIGYEILEKMGIANIANNTLRSLSKGQFQRVMISRALISKPEILLLDEPTSNVDVHSQKNFFDVLKKINDEGITILVVFS